MLDKKDWDEFRKTGLLWFINSILHLFGWAIVIEMGDGGATSKSGAGIKDVYPARTIFRGFSEEENTKGYEKVTRYLQENIDGLLEEAKDEKE